MLQLYVAVRGFAERADDRCRVVDCRQAVAPHVADQHADRMFDVFGGVHVTADVCVGGCRAVGRGDLQPCHTAGQRGEQRLLRCLRDGAHRTERSMVHVAHAPEHEDQDADDQQAQDVDREDR